MNLTPEPFQRSLHNKIILYLRETRFMQNIDGEIKTEIATSYNIELVWGKKKSKVVCPLVSLVFTLKKLYYI